MTTALPPAYALVQDETKGLIERPQAFARRLRDRGLWRDLVGQASAAIASPHYFVRDKASGGLDIAGDSGLDPLTWMGKCGCPDHRVSAAEGFARFAALYFDHVVIPDHLAEVLRANPERPAHRSIAAIADMLTVLPVVQPLLDRGILRLVDPSTAVCEHCHAKFIQRGRDVVRDLSQEVLDSCELVLDWRIRKKPQLIIKSPLFRVGSIELSPAVELLPARALDLAGPASRGAIVPVPRSALSGRKLELARILRELVVDSQASAIRAAYAGLPVGTDSFASARTLQSLDGTGEGVLRIPNELATADIELPWLPDLNLQQALELREVAREALPRFRETLRDGFFPSRNQADSVDRRRQVVRSLAIDAREVEAELAARNPAATRTRMHGLGVASIGLSLLALGVNDHALALEFGGAAFSAWLGLASAQDQHDAQVGDITELKARPGFVLLQARGLLGDEH